MERIEARNGLESYLYNTRNSLREDKVKETLGENTVSDTETIVNEGLAWLEANGESAEVEELKAKQKHYEEQITPVMMKLYQSSGSSAGGMPDMAGMKMPETTAPAPKVEEVD
jgi:L1 cell adhesion molecule like protein